MDSLLPNLSIVLSILCICFKSIMLGQRKMITWETYSIDIFNSLLTRCWLFCCSWRRCVKKVYIGVRLGLQGLCNRAYSFGKSNCSIWCTFFMLTGTVAGLYVGTGYGVERIRGTRDWVILSNMMTCNLIIKVSVL